jgi:hypothetical protein
MVSRRELTLLLLSILASVIYARAQYELPDEIFQRTLLIRCGDEMATAFKFEQGGTVYLVTTRHLAKNLPLTNAIVQVWHGSWIEFPTVRTLFPSSKDVDLAILVTDEKMGAPYKVAKSSEVLTTGQKVWFMGWPGPIPQLHPPAYTPKTLRPIFPEIPMVKIGAISAIDPTRPDSFEVNAIEGSSKPSYSLRIAPGPIVYWSTVHKDFEVLGVISRDQPNAKRVSIYGRPPEDVVQSRLLRAYGIDVVADAVAGK